jgi:hypothetical protein
MIWYNVINSNPLATETGGWDGKRSDKILVFTRNRKYHVARMYNVIMDGHQTFDFYDDSDFEIQHVTHWIEIDGPL